jgi:transglutaminase-like putative cysteine protease
VERFFELSMVALVASGFLAVAGSGHLDVPTLALTSAALVLRGLSALGVIRFRVPDRVSTVLTLAYIGFFPLDYLFLSQSFLNAVVHLVFFLAFLKLLTAQTNRDYFFLAVISFLELLAASIVSANLNFFLFLAAYLLASACAFTSAEIRRSIQMRQSVARSPVRNFQPRLALFTGAVAGGILLLTSGLFFLLPRTANAAFRHLVSERYFLPGFSNHVTLGQIGQVKADSRAVMHVRVYGKGPVWPQKWRGAALTLFDGSRWSNPAGSLEAPRTERGMQLLADNAQRQRTGERITYQVDLHALDTDALFFAGIPEWLHLSNRTSVRPSREGWRLGFIPENGFRYEAGSYVEEFRSESGPAPREPDPSLKQYLQLPAIDPRVAALAKQFAGDATLPSQQARNVEQQLRTQYGYTLQLLSEPVADPLAHFLFERKKGHCEYFASAMTVMLRSLGIPARLVNGFQSGTLNPYSGLWVVRASDAHSWVEANLPGIGWTAFDPTPPDPNPSVPTLLTKLSLYMDAAETFWRDWVLSYDLGRQVVLVDRVERSGRRFQFEWIHALAPAAQRWKGSAVAWLSAYGLPAVAALVIGAALWFTGPKLWRLLRVRHGARRMRRGEGSVADATILYDRMLELLRRRGYQKPSWFTASEFASSLPASDLRSLVAEFTAAYQEVRFGGRVESAPHLSSLLEQLEQRR